MSPAERLPLKVFIADDSAPVAEILTELLAAPGEVEVVGVGDSEDTAIDAIARMKPDAVILDLQLKSGSGANVIRAVRGNAAIARTRVLVMSNHASPQLRAGCLELGADDYFDKVKDLARLAQCIAGLAKRKDAGDL